MPCPPGQSQRPSAQEGGANSYVLVAGLAQKAPPRSRRPQLVRLAAQPIPEPEPEPKDIIVTASKRDTSQRFPGQWSRIDGDEFAPLGVPGTEAIEVALGRIFLDASWRRPKQAVHPRNRRSQFQRPDPVAGRPIFRRHAHRLQRARSLT